MPTTLSPWRRRLGDQNDGFVAACGDGAVSGGVGAASLGPTAVFSRFGWPSRGLGHMDVLAQDLPVVAVAVWEHRALGRLSTHLCSMTTQCMSPPPAIRLNFVAELPV